MVVQAFLCCRAASGACSTRWTTGDIRMNPAVAAIYTLIATAKLNDVDPQAWLADVLACLPDHPAKRIHELLPWNLQPQSVAHAA
jgi:hypothetical protein